MVGEQATRASLKGETTASSADRQRRTLEQLLWPQAFGAHAVAEAEEDEGGGGMIAGDPAKANGRGMTPLHLAVQWAADGRRSRRSSLP